jgi:putative transposase
MPCGRPTAAGRQRHPDSGTPVADVCRQLGVSEATFYVWRKKFAHLGVSELRRMRQLEDENARLKRLMADLTLDTHILTETLRKTANADLPASTGDLACGDVPGAHRVPTARACRLAGLARSTWYQQSTAGISRRCGCAFEISPKHGRGSGICGFTRCCGGRVGA